MEEQDAIAIAAAMSSHEGGVDVRDRPGFLHTRIYYQTFVGSEAITWLAQKKSVSREQAVDIGKQIAAHGLVLSHGALADEIRDANEYFGFVRRPAVFVRNLKRDDAHHDMEEIDGQACKLFLQCWHPINRDTERATAVRAAILLHQGLKDHSDRYRELAHRLRTQGIAVYAFDMQGHGRSGGDPQFQDDFDNYVQDCISVLELMAEREPTGIPLFLYGYSLGGQVALETALLLQNTQKVEKDEDEDEQDLKGKHGGDKHEHSRLQLRGLILAAPALDPDQLPVRLIQIVSYFAPHLKVVRFHVRDFVSDPDIRAEIDADPLIYHTPVAAGTIGQLVDSMRRTRPQFSRLILPFLTIHEKADIVTTTNDSIRLYETASSKDKSLLLVDGLLHDVIHDRPKSLEVLEAVEAFVLSRLTKG